MDASSSSSLSLLLLFQDGWVLLVAVAGSSLSSSLRQPRLFISRRRAVVQLRGRQPRHDGRRRTRSPATSSHVTRRRIAQHWVSAAVRALLVATRCYTPFANSTSSPRAVSLSWQWSKLGGVYLRGNCPREYLGRQVVPENDRAERPGILNDPMQDYKSLRVVVMICATMVNTQTHRQTTFDRLCY